MITKEEKQIFYSKLNYVLAYLEKQNISKSNIMVLGSGALMTCGLPMDNAPHDIDLDIICSEEDERILKAITDIGGNSLYNNKETYVNSVHKPYIFKIPFQGFNDIIVNVWAVKEFSHAEFICREGIKYATAWDVLKVKASYARKKDTGDIVKLANKILSLI